MVTNLVSLKKFESNIRTNKFTGHFFINAIPNILERCMDKRSFCWCGVKQLNHIKVLGKSKNSVHCNSWTAWTCSPHQSSAGELHSLTHSRESINPVPRHQSLSASEELHNSALDMLWRPNEHLQQVTECIRCIRVSRSHVWRKIRSKVTPPRGARCHLGGERTRLWEQARTVNAEVDAGNASEMRYQCKAGDA